MSEQAVCAVGIWRSRPFRTFDRGRSPDDPRPGERAGAVRVGPQRASLSGSGVRRRGARSSPETLSDGILPADPKWADEDRPGPAGERSPDAVRRVDVSDFIPHRGTAGASRPASGGGSRRSLDQKPSGSEEGTVSN